MDVPFAIEFQHVSKSFSIDSARSRSFKEVLIDLFRRRVEEKREPFKVLDDVSFQLAQGETIGFIGANGAGKSTALKLMAGIITPDSGRVGVHGTLAALLELGAGFHPDLTGRENVYLNGSILGLSHKQITRKLSDIVAFSELDRFIDMPVKHYSSGMYMRLGFSVAVNLDPDILLVDEVLSVGDQAFQHKCNEKIREMQRAGVSIVLVTHGVDMVRSICDRAIWIHEGVMAMDGTPDRVVDAYIEASAAEEQANRTKALLAGRADAPASDVENAEEAKPLSRWGNESMRINGVRLYGKGHQPAVAFQSGDEMRIEIDYQIQQGVQGVPAFGVGIYRIMDGVLCYGTNTALDKAPVPDASLLPPLGMVAVEFPALQLLSGDYALDVAVHDQNGAVMYDYIKGILHFSVQNPRRDQGLFRADLSWKFDF